MKKTVSLLSLLIYLSLNLYAQTPVEGEQFGSWLSENSPYEVIGEINIPVGETLTIEAGVEVNFQAHYKLTVYGNLQALGTITYSIFFTTDIPETGWGGIRFVDTDGMNNLKL